MSLNGSLSPPVFAAHGRVLQPDSGSMIFDLVGRGRVLNWRRPRRIDPAALRGYGYVSIALRCFATFTAAVRALLRITAVAEGRQVVRERNPEFDQTGSAEASHSGMFPIWQSTKRTEDRAGEPASWVRPRADHQRRTVRPGALTAQAPSCSSSAGMSSGRLPP